MEGFERIAPDVYRLRVPFPGCWTGVALVCGAQNVLVDSGGSPETVDSCIVPALAKLGLAPQDIAYLALTHIHGDHVGGCARLKALAPGMKVAVFAQSLERIRDPKAYSRRIRERFPGHGAPVPQGLEGVEPGLLLQDGDRLLTLRLVHTPGHDTDSCCYLEQRTGTLITGDSLQLNGTVSQGCALLMDAPGYGRTLRKLREMDIRNLLCGHPYLPLGDVALGPEAVREYLAACAACDAHDQGFVAGMLAAGEEDAAAIARALIHEVGGRAPEHLFLPLHTVTEYIHKRRRRL
ncbi:MAG: MBL fold metallo-hydrolase [Candidatus Limiplasma sp.]|nr:MBL fold metallo-hydrolase [Candidatus Limiplasma sp.]